MKEKIGGRMLTADTIKFELTQAAISGMRSVQDLNEYFKRRKHQEMLYHIRRHPVSALEVLNDIIDAAK